MARFPSAALVIVAFSVFTAFAPQDRRPTVIMISADGWRWDYHTRAQVPNVRSLMARGIHADSLIPSFTQKTFPNHYTLVTGLYPGHHGVVGNTMRDPKTGRMFAMANREEVGDAVWWGGDPIWNTAQRTGLKTAAMFWPGSEAPIGGTRPTFWTPYDHAMPNDRRVDQVLRWLDLPVGERPSFLTLYFSDVDGTGHSFGPDSADVLRALERVDTAIGRLLDGLDERGLDDEVNVVVVSDHGMAETSRQRVILIDELIPPADAEIVEANPTLGLWPRAGRLEAVYSRVATAHPRLSIYRRENTPEHWHYRDHERVPPIMGVADEGWSVMRRQTVSEAFARSPRGIGGNHGYDPQVRTMHGIFVAAGPAFRRNVVVPSFENIHVYNTLCFALGIEPAKNDGDRAVALSLLK